MRCEDCGQVSDWVGDGSDWHRVGGANATRPLVECEDCGNTQHAR
jgi:ribosomal protein S27E